MIAIDIETTGLDPEKHQILEFVAVLENGNFFHRLIKWNDYVINEYCLKLHKQLLGEITENKLTKTLIISIDDLGRQFTRWLGRNHTVTNYNVVGVNWAGFDGLFLKKVPEFPKWNYRVLELGSLYFDGLKVHGLEDIEPIDNAHRALPDAQATMRAFLRKRTELQSPEYVL